jgi:uncharacterized protein (DUF58 family)
MKLPEFLRDKKAIRFAIISLLLVTAALASALVSAAAGQIGDQELASFMSKVALGLCVVILIYVVPRLAQQAWREILRSRLSLNITSAGWVFSIFVLIVGAASLTTANNLLYVVLAVLLATLVVSGVASRLNLNDISVALRFPDHIFATQPTDFEITLINQKRFFPSFSLTTGIADHKPAKQWWQTWLNHERREQKKKAGTSHQRTVNFTLIPINARARIQMETIFDKRGVYPISGFAISSRFPFGFVERRRFIDAHGEILVYPQPQPMDDFYHLLPISQGQMNSLLKGSGSDLYSIRQYLRTDHPRHVDWKATAKVSRMMVREFTRDDDWRITIALDPNLENDIGEVSDSGSSSGIAVKTSEEKFEAAVTLAASLASHFLTEGAEVQLIVGHEDSGFGHDETHRYAMLKSLARATPVRNEKNALTSDGEGTSWELLKRLPALAADNQFRILITASPRGSIPANIWRNAHVIHLDDL